MPDVDPGPPVWLLGSSVGSAAAAGQLGLPYTFAAFINPAQARAALDTYRHNFTPADGPGAPPAPHAMLAINAVSADTDDEAAYHAMTVHGLYHRLSQGVMGSTHPSPAEAIAEIDETTPATSTDRRWDTRSIAGNPDRIRGVIEAMAADVAADEVMIQDMILDQSAREYSYQLLAKTFALNST